jgi:hypothetical protein
MSGFLYALGRGLQLVGLAVVGLAVIAGFRGDPEIAFVLPCVAGLAIFYLGLLILKRFGTKG